MSSVVRCFFVVVAVCCLLCVSCGLLVGVFFVDCWCVLLFAACSLLAACWLVLLCVVCLFVVRCLFFVGVCWLLLFVVVCSALFVVC